MKKRTNKNKNGATLDAQERAIERAIGRGAYVSVPNRLMEIKRAQAIAKNTFAKTKTVNIRISESDLVRLRARAYRDGIPYQTYIASLIRKAVVHSK